MTKVNMLEAKTELSKLIRSIETGQEEVIYIARNGKVVAQITRVPHPLNHRRFGTAKGPYPVNDEAFDAWDREVEGMFGGEIE